MLTIEQLTSELLLVLDDSYLKWHYFEILVLLNEDNNKITSNVINHGHVPGLLVKHMYMRENSKTNNYGCGLIIGVNTIKEQALVLWAHT
jgi:hypothetical protein